MADTNKIVSEAEFRGKFSDGVSRGADAAAASLKKLGDEAVKADAATQKAEERVRRADKTFESIARRYDETAMLAAKTAKATREYEAAVKACTEAIKTGTKTEEEVAAVLKNATLARDAAIASAKKEAEAFKAKYQAIDAELKRVEASTGGYITTLERLASAESRVARVRDAIDSSTGLDRRGSLDQYEKRAADIAAYGNELDRLRSKYDPLFAASRRYSQAIEEINFAQRTGAITAAGAALAREKERLSYDASVASLRRVAGATTEAGRQVSYTGYQLTQLSYQFNDVIAQMSTGTSPLIILTQQGPQVAQILGGWKQSMREIASFITPARAAVAGFTVAIVAFMAVANSAEQRLSTLRNQLRGYIADYRDAARQLEGSSRAQSLVSPGFSLTNITEAQSAFTRTRVINDVSQSTESLVRTAMDLSKTLDRDLASAVERLTRYMRDPAAAAKELQENGFRGMNEELRRQIELFQISGNRVEAFTLLFATLSRNLDNARTDTGNFTKAINDLAKAFETLWENIRPIMESIGRDILERFTRMATFINEMVDGIRFITNSSRPSAVSGGNPGSPGVAWNGANGDFYAAIRGAEGGRAGYRARNDYGYLGAYQFGAAALTDLGFYTPAPRERRQGGILNTWQGTWNIPGVTSAEDFLGNPGAQDEAARRFVAAIDRIIDQNNLLQAGPIRGVPVTRDALRAAGWLRPGDLTQFVQSGGQFNPGDANGMTLFERFYRFSPGGQNAPVPVAVVSDTSGPATAPAPGNRDYNTRLNTALSEARSGSVQTREDALGRIDRFTSLRNEIEQVNQGLLEQARTVEQGSEAWNTLQAQLAQNYANMTILDRGIDSSRAALVNARGAVEEFIDRLERQADVNRDAGSAMQTLNQRYLELDEISRRERGVGANEVERDRVRLATLREMSVQYGNTVDQLDRQITAESRITEAYGRSSAAAQIAAARERAREEVRKTAIRGTSVEAEAIEGLTRKYLELQRVEAERATASNTSAQERELSFIREETNLIGQSAQYRERELAALRTRNEIVGRNPSADLLSPTNQAAIRMAQSVADARLEQERLRDAYREIERLGTQAFDRIGEAITQAFADGSMETIKWGNIAKAVVSEIAQALIRLAIINPIINMTMGGNRATLDDVGRVVGQSGFGQMTGLSGLLPTGGFSSAINSTAASWFPSVFGTGATTGAGAATSSAAAVAASLPTAMSALSGIGLGFGAGTMLNSFARGNQTGGMIGSGVGALAGVAASLLIPGVGAVIGPLLAGALGGSAGGLLGGLFGGGKGFSGGDAFFDVTDSGTLSFAGTRGKKYDAGALTNDATGQMNQLNQVLGQLGLSFSGRGRFAMGVGGSRSARSLEEALNAAGMGGTLRSSDSRINAMIGRMDAGNIRGILEAVQQANGLVEVLNKLGEPTGQYARALKEINDRFGPWIETAQRLGFGERELSEARNKAIQQLDKQRDTELMGMRISRVQRRMNASGVNDLGSLLWIFDEQARISIDGLRTSLEDMGATAEVAAWHIADEEATLAAERLAIIRGFNEKVLQEEERARGAVINVLDGIVSFARGLLVGELSPLSPRGQFSAAQADFNSLAAAASAGDYKSLQRLSGVAQTYLQQAQNVYGGGAGYAEVFSQVLSVLQGVGNTSEAALTASAMEAIAREQTANLGLKLDELKAVMKQILSEFRVSSMEPAR